jgi:hemolysin D
VQKLLPEQHYLEAEQDRLEMSHDLRSHQGHVAELEAGIRELEARVEFAKSEFRRQVLERHEEASRRQAAVRQELIKAETRTRAHTISAPVDGVVQQLAIHNVGAVVTPAQELMVIVPQDGALEVEAFLENKDIGFVEVGQQAEIKIDTFPFTRYGTLAGRVVDLSKDAVADEHKGLVYKMRVVMESSQIRVNGKPVALSPGMSVSVESKTGTRRMIEFFLSPLLRYADESVRER